MIAFVHGIAVDMTESSVVVEAGGIGYEIYMTGADLSEIRMGEDVKVHIAHITFLPQDMC